MSFDTSLLYFLNGLAGHLPLLDWLIIFCASYVPYLTVVLCVVLIMRAKQPLAKRWEALAVALLASAIAGFFVSGHIQAFFRRPRPFMALPDIHGLLSSSSSSFPSAHASFFFALAAGAYLYDRRLGTVFFALALLISAARVAAGLHYPSDILGGAVLGILVALGLYFTVRHLVKKGIITTY